MSSPATCPVTGRDAVPAPARTEPAGGVAVEAATYLRTCAVELGWSRSEYQDRRSAVLREIADTGTYRHTVAELELGAKLAWRNHTRCIGQLYWRTLRVRDRRQVSGLDEVVAEVDEHLTWSYNGGRIRPVITIFAPDEPGAPGLRLLSPQLVRYAGYRQPEGGMRGDPANAALTDQLVDLGWVPGNGSFDRLPLLIRLGDGTLAWRELDPRSCPDVPIVHPEHKWLAEFGLRWYAFPTVSDMRLEIGGITYPAAPFSGWYVGPEIGARNFGDTDRYDLLPAVAVRMGLDIRSDRTLWKDRALIELNVAVLASFEEAGVRILDHHTMTDQFHRYAQARCRGGEAVYADWSWIVPPIASSATPVFHQSYDATVVRPNFFRG